MPTTPPHRKKLIEVALPLDAINAESAREKSIRHGHPSTLHLWWARRPLAACRAVLFASLVDDPGNDLPEDEAKKERERLFRLIEQLVKWENSNNETVLAAARAEIVKSTNGNPPPVLDPFCGGGSIPLEAQRLGLEAHASDVNPVAVLITKALIELPAKFRDHPPVNPDAKKGMRAEAAPKSALADDVRWYGKWMRDEAYRRIGHLYPKGANGETVIAWIWARTVRCPNPACGAQMPLVRSFVLSSKQSVWVEPLVDQAAKTVQFAIRQGSGSPAGTVSRAGARCIVCGSPVAFDYVRSKGKGNQIGTQLMAVVGEGAGGRIYLAPTEEHVNCASKANPSWRPEALLSGNRRDIHPPQYGMTSFGDLFTARQLVSMSLFSDLVDDAASLILDHSGGDVDYTTALATYLAFGVDRLADRSSSVCSWDAGYVKVRNVFARPGIPMAWDFAEANPFSSSTGNFVGAVEWIAEVIEASVGGQPGRCTQLDAMATIDATETPIISTDPPYYDNVPYADLADFFYVWLRRSIAKFYPSLFSTVLSPRTQELVAAPYRLNGNRDQAKQFFEEGLSSAFTHMREAQRTHYPVTIYYAFKQTETEGNSDLGPGGLAVSSTGWETMLAGLLRTGFTITGTWPVRTELMNRSISSGANALASSIVVVCRPRPSSAPIGTRREFISALGNELPSALSLLIRGTVGVSAIAPVDLAQAAIGPGMAVFSRYSQVIEASGEPMRVRTALELINAEIDKYFSTQEGEQDSPTRFCLGWYRSHGTDEGLFGEAQVLSRAVDVDIDRLRRMGLLYSAAGKVRLHAVSEYPDEAWDPSSAHPLTTWETTHRLAAALASSGGIDATATLAQRLGGKAEEARELAYLLYQEASKRGWTAEAASYNDLVVSWPDILKRAAEKQGTVQERLI